ncbi:MAG: FtsQ-type POTRA domain-containing protein [Deltaproteobacteria bacterium]|nr:FtsQ-type POTRA domain-containing protein [Deltaproteobacteria bacterium]
MAGRYLQNQTVVRSSNKRMEELWQERREKGNRFKGYFSTLGILALMAILFWGSARVYKVLAQSSLFEVKDIQINDLEWTKRESVLNLAQMNEKSNLLSIDLKETQRKVMENPWIKNVEITRFFPSTLKFTIVEHKPAALIVLDDKLHFVDDEGSVIKQVDPSERRDFPIITGIRDIIPHLELIRSALQVVKSCQEIVTNKISEIFIDPSYGFTLFTAPPLSPEPFSPLQRAKVYFGFEDIPQQMIHLSKVVADLRSKGLAAHTVDLRFREKVIVKIDK